MPPVPLPPDFERYITNTTTPGRSPFAESGNGTLSIIGANGQDRATVYVGAIFDGDRSFENFTSALPSVRIKFYSTPVINASNVIIAFNPKRQYYLDVLVSNEFRMTQYNTGQAIVLVKGITLTLVCL
jgi:hypothetical protein